MGLRRLEILFSVILGITIILIGAGCRKSEGGGIPGEWRFIKDDQGRSLVLHGVNASGSAKWDPQRMPNLIKDDVLRLSKDWGFNAARFLILWDYAEQEPGVYNQGYFDLIEERLDWFQEAGIFVFLDMHQDLYSHEICPGGDGAPLWAVITDGLPVDCDQISWSFIYFQPGVTRAFDNFWNYSGPHPELQDHYIALWATIADRFKDHPAIIGYDIINEPFPGSDFDMTELAGKDNPTGPSKTFDQTKIQPFYQRVINAIREKDAEHWIFFEPRYGTPAEGRTSYIGRMNDPRPGESRIVYAPHLYSVTIEAGSPYNPISNPIVLNWEETRKKELKTLQYPLLVGEWGIKKDLENGPLYLRHVLDMYDRQMAGWTYWDYSPTGGYSFINPDRSEYITLTTVLVRVYPQRVAGVPQSYSYNPDTRVFTMEYIDDPNATGPTEIYIPETRIYPSGWDLLMSDPDGSWTMDWDDVKEIASVTIGQGTTSSTHLLQILPK